MKRNNVAKRFGIASLCLGVALSAFSGIAPQTNSVALADGEVAVTDFVYTTAETVERTTEYTLSDQSSSADGLRLTSDVAYEGTFKTVFTGDTTLNFRFPETYDADKGYYGSFRIRIADVDDDSNYFDIAYYMSQESSGSKKVNTSAYLNYIKDGNDIKRYGKYDGSEWCNGTATTNTNGACAPSFLSYNCSASENGDAYKMGYLELTWEEDVLWVYGPGLNRTRRPLGAFDGTYSSAKSPYGFKASTKWGLPKISFENGYTISFYSEITGHITSAGTRLKDTAPDDKGTDVFFTSIKTNGGTYDLSGETVAVDEGMTKFNDTFATEAPTPEAGKVFLGWKDAEGLHPHTNNGALAEKLLRRSEYEEVTIAYDTIDGASVRIDTTGGKSGIRFMTTFDIDEYASVEAYITEKGTLIAKTDELDASMDFTIANYQAVIDADGNVKKVVNSTGVYDYEAQDGTTYKAYSMAIEFSGVSENQLAAYYTTAYSARGYLVVTYADGSTATIYTDYDADKNSRSIAQTAYNLTTVGKAEYDTYTTAQKTIVDTYAGYYSAN